MKYEDVVEIEIEHETQEELEIDLEDLKDEFTIIEEESESESVIADSCYENDSDNHAEVTSCSITRAEISTLDRTNKMRHILLLFIYFKLHSSDRDKFCSLCMIYFLVFMLFANMLLINIYILMVCIVRNIEIRCIKYYHAIYALFAYERHLMQLCKNYTF